MNEQALVDTSFAILKGLLRDPPRGDVRVDDAVRALRRLADKVGIHPREALDAAIQALERTEPTVIDRLYRFARESEYYSAMLGRVH